MTLVGKERAQKILQDNTEQWAENMLAFAEKHHPKEEGEEFIAAKIFKKEGRGVVVIIEGLDSSLGTIEHKQAYLVSELASKITLDDE